jgi:Uma2 family endonuclease
MQDLQSHAISVKAYHKMAEVGILPDNIHVELINGTIYDMSPIGNEHNEIVDLLTKILILSLGEKARVRVQGSILLNKTEREGEPEPDLTLLKPKSYFDTSATADDVYLLIEVSDSTLEKDHKLKLPFYAANNIPEVWIINIPEKTIEIYQKPINNFYSYIRKSLKPSVFTPLLIPDTSLDLSKLF